MNKLVKKTIAGFTIGLVTLYTLPMYAFASTESVYSKLKNDGESYQTIVTTKDGDDVKQEEVEKDLPVETKVTYTLDGKEISAKDLAGKSGKVSIKIEYINKSSKNVYVNGSYQTMYTPFVMVVGTMIDSENNKNIEVENGKVIENGGKAIVVGVVLPGLEESLNLTGTLAGINIPSSIEITMDSKNFEMKNIVSYASPKLIDGDINWDKFDILFNKVNVLQSSANQLEDGVNSLKDGISELKVGSETLNNGASELNNGANQLDNGINSLQTGANTLNEGANKLSEGTLELSNGAASVNQGASSLNVGIKELQTGLQSAGSGIANLQSGSSQVATGATSVNEGAENLEKGLKELQIKTSALAGGMNIISTSVSELSDGMSYINTQVQGVQTELAAYANQVESLQTLIETNTAMMNSTSDENLKAVLQQNIVALKKEQQLLAKTANIAELANGINTVTGGLNTLNESTKNLPTQATALTGGIDMLVNGASQLSQGTEALSTGANALSNGADTLAQGASQLTSGVSQLADGSDELVVGTRKLSNGAEVVNNGASELSKGTGSIVGGAKQLSEGSRALSDGTKTLVAGTTSFVEGATKLESGSNELAAGMHKFNSEGINKIANFVNGDLGGLVSRTKKLQELANDYVSFSSEEKRESIKFISIIDSVKTSQIDEDNQDANIDEKK